MSKKILEVKNLTMRFGGLTAVDDLSFDVLENEIVGIIGPNGAGKTTVFNCITQFYKDYEGDILFLKDPKLLENEKKKYINKKIKELKRTKTDITEEVKDKLQNEANGTINEYHLLNDINVTKIINIGLVRTFQNIQLVPDLSILDNVLIGAHNQFKTNIFSHLLHTRKAKKEDLKLRMKAIEILKAFNLQNIMFQYAFGQPYGVLKKIEIARTLMSNPKTIILDEPAAGLNDLETKELTDIIYRIRDEYNCSIVLIEHDMGFVMEVCDRICAINFGKFLAMDKPKVIQSNKDVQEAYLGGDDDE